MLTVTPTYEYYKSDYQNDSTIAAKFGPASSTTNYPFFAKVYKHLHAKTANVSGKFYRYPIPKSYTLGTVTTTFNVTPQNPGY